MMCIRFSGFVKEILIPSHIGHGKAKNEGCLQKFFIFFSVSFPVITFMKCKLIAFSNFEHEKKQPIISERLL